MRLVRARMAETGENYTSALAGILGETELAPLPESWKLTGSHAADYQVGLLPGAEMYDGGRIVLLRSRPDVKSPAGFGAFVQSIRATRYLGLRVQFTAMSFGALLSGAGALQIAGPRFATVSKTVPVTTRPFGESLPDEPQALDF